MGCFNKRFFNKFASLGLKIIVFWNKGYDVTISAHDVTKTIIM